MRGVHGKEQASLRVFVQAVERVSDKLARGSSTLPPPCLLQFLCFPPLAGVDVLEVEFRRLLFLDRWRLAKPRQGILEVHPAQTQALIAVFGLPLYGALQQAGVSPLPIQIGVEGVDERQKSRFEIVCVPEEDPVNRG
jgi:hypothetical protein